MKKLICFIMLCILCGCSTSNTRTNDKSYPTTSFVDKLSDKNINSAFVGVELVQPYTPDYMKSLADHIVLASVVSIDSSDMVHNSVVGSTYGTLYIQDTLFGDSLNSKLISFQKPGCILKTLDYEAAQPQEAQDKHAYLRGQSNIVLTDQDYVDILTEGDIPIEVQKSYLVYLNYNKTTSTYDIIGLGNGLRELNVPLQTDVKTTDFDISNISIKNNETGQFENLEAYIDSKIK